MTDSAHGILYAVDITGSRNETYAKQHQIDTEIKQSNNRQSETLLAMSRRQTWQTVISMRWMYARFRS